MILEQCKGVHCVDLVESFRTHIYLQNSVSIQPRTSPVKFAASCTTTPAILRRYRGTARTTTYAAVTGCRPAVEHRFSFSSGKRTVPNRGSRFLFGGMGSESSLSFGKHLDFSSRNSIIYFSIEVTSMRGSFLESGYQYLWT